MKTMLKLGGVLVLLLVVYMAIRLVGPSALERNTSAFLSAVQAEEFEKAAKLYGGISDPANAGRWAGEMRKLHEEQGFRLLSFDGVKAEYDDGCFCTGHARLTFEVAGEPLEVEAILTFGESKPRQVCAFSHPEKGTLPELEAWDRLACHSSF